MIPPRPPTEDDPALLKAWYDEVYNYLQRSRRLVFGDVLDATDLPTNTTTGSNETIKTWTIDRNAFKQNGDRLFFGVELKCFFDADVDLTISGLPGFTPVTFSAASAFRHIFEGCLIYNGVSTLEGFVKYMNDNGDSDVIGMSGLFTPSAAAEFGVRVNSATLSAIKVVSGYGELLPSPQFGLSAAIRQGQTFVL